MDFSKLVVPEDLSFGVDDSITLDERELQIPLNLSEVGVTNDNKVERLNFKVPAVFDGVNDLSTFTWWVNYRNALGYDNLYHVDDLKKEGDYLTFSWLTDENLYAESGDAHFSLRATHEDGRAFGTKVATLRVAKGLNTASTIYEHDYDFINQYFSELDGMKKEVQTGVSQIEGVKADAESARNSAEEAKQYADKIKTNIPDTEMSDTSMNPVQNKIVKKYIDDLGTINSIKRYFGNISTVTGNWNNINEKYQHVVIPVNPNDKVEMFLSAESVSVTFAFVTDYIKPVEGQSPLFSSQPGFDKHKSINSKMPFEGYAPSDAKYIIVINKYNVQKIEFTKLKINYYDYVKKAKENLTSIYNVIETKAAVEDENVSKKTTWSSQKIKEEIENSAGLTFDSELSGTSENAVQNKIVKKYLDNLDLYDIDHMTLHKGHINSEKRWNNLNEQYQHIIIPVRPHDKIDIALTGHNTYIAFLKEYKVVEGQSVEFSIEENQIKNLTERSSISLYAPSDAKYMLVEIVYANFQIKLTHLIVENYNYLKNAKYNLTNSLSNSSNALKKVDDCVSEIELFKGIKKTVEWFSGTFHQNIGQASGELSQNTRIKTGYLMFDIDIFVKSSKYKTNVVVYDNQKIVVSSTGYTIKDKRIPANTLFRVIGADSTSDKKDISGVSNDELNRDIIFENSNFKNIMNSNKRVCFLGDSITEGWVSFLENGQPQSKVDAKLGWAYYFSNLKNWNADNYAIGGTGFIKPKSSNPTNTAGWELAKTIDFKPYDIVVIAYGINDWKGNIPTGTLEDDDIAPTTTIGGMKSLIKTILKSNPFIKIKFLTPLNCMGYTFDFGNEQSNWALGHRFSNSGTLEEFYQAMVSVFDFYGIEYVDNTHYSIVNRLNIQNLLLDGVHPSAEAHSALAKDMVDKL